MDAQNYITLQHNVLSEWLHGNLCLIYEALNGTCATFIGPLEEDQVFVPVELSWPEGQPNMMERLEQIQSTLSLGALDDVKDGNDDSEITEQAQSLLRSAISDQMRALEGKFDLHSAGVQSKVDVVESKVDALTTDMKGKVDKLEGKFDSKFDVHSRKMEAVESKVDAIESSMKEIEQKLSKIMDLLAKE